LRISMPPFPGSVSWVRYEALNRAPSSLLERLVRG